MALLYLAGTFGPVLLLDIYIVINLNRKETR